MEKHRSAVRILPSALRINENASDFFKQTRLEPLVTGLPILDEITKRSGEVIELYGPSGSGKTEFLLQALVACILPKKWGPLELCGADSDAVFIDADLRFSIERVVVLLHARIVEAALKVQAISTEDNIEPGTLYPELVRSSLRRLRVFRCTSSLDLLCTLQYLHYSWVSPTRPSLRLLLIDSASAFFWPDRGGMDLDTQNRLAGGIALAVKQLASEQHVMVLSTKSMYFRAQRGVEAEGIDRDGAGRLGVNEQERDINQKDKHNVTVDLSREVTGGKWFVDRDVMGRAWQLVVHRRLSFARDVTSVRQDAGMEGWPVQQVQVALPTLGPVHYFVVHNKGISFVNGPDPSSQMQTQ